MSIFEQARRRYYHLMRQRRFAEIINCGFKIIPMEPSDFQEDNNFGEDYLGNNVDEYFYDFIRDYPFEIERLDKILEAFFKKGFEDGVTQGMMHGMMEGAQQKEVEVIMRMLNMKAMTSEKIAQATGILKSDIEWVKKRWKKG